MKNAYTFLITCALFVQVHAQSPVENVSEIVAFLADDRLEGRATGSRGEEIAANYIAARFASMGLEPAGDNSGYFQIFDFRAGKQPGTNNFILIGDKHMDTKPVFLSGNGQVKSEMVFAGYGIQATDLNHDDYADIDVQGKIAIIQLSTPDGTHPHTPYYSYADERAKVQLAEKMGAIAVVFVNSDEQYETSFLTDYSNNAEPENIPVALIEDQNWQNQAWSGKTATMQTELDIIRKEGKNVAGMINNGADCTVIIGAHYDHLGYGESGGSLYRGEPAIHNGADDNASGVALILELADELSASGLTGYNYMFIAFSGEELGLYGSKSIANFLSEGTGCYNYMLNFDMVGRLDSVKNIIVNGYGTSPEWKRLEGLTSANHFLMKTFQSGIGPSDHTSFYMKEIPVLHFFTGTHSDYHKPGDDADKINYPGIIEVMDLVKGLVLQLDKEEQVAYVKTSEDSNEDAPRFTVTLGVIPDYTFEGKGMRIDGVSDDRPADVAGLLAGDIVIGLGTYPVGDMMGYMKALSMFEKGDATTVTVERKTEELTFPIQF